jgi:hypothetical protein
MGVELLVVAYLATGAPSFATHEFPSMGTCLAFAKEFKRGEGVGLKNIVAVCVPRSPDDLGMASRG